MSVVEAMLHEPILAAQSSMAMTPVQARDPNYFPGFAVAVSLGIQHFLTMFVSNLTR